MSPSFSTSLGKLSLATNQDHMDRTLQNKISLAYAYMHNNYHTLLLTNAENRQKKLANLEKSYREISTMLITFIRNPPQNPQPSSRRRVRVTADQTPVDRETLEKMYTLAYDSFLNCTFEYKLCIIMGKPLPSIPYEFKENLLLLLKHKFFTMTPDEQFQALIAIKKNVVQNQRLEDMLYNHENKKLFKEFIENIFCTAPDLLKDLKTQGYHHLFHTISLPNRRTKFIGNWGSTTSIDEPTPLISITKINMAKKNYCKTFF